MPIANTSTPAIIVDTVTVSSSQDLSTFIDLIGLTLVGIITPAALTSTKISFLTTPDPIISAFMPYFNTSGSLVESEIGLLRQIGFLPADFASVRFIQIKTNVVEAATREFKLVSRRAA